MSKEPARTGPRVIDFTFHVDDPLTKEELALSYSKYYYVPFTPLGETHRSTASIAV